jgi:hypothetical protein
VVDFLVVGIFYNPCRCHNALHVRLKVSMFCKISHHYGFLSFYIIMVFFSYPSMDFDVYYDIDCEALHGEGGSLQFTSVIGIINELIQRVAILDVVEVMIKGVIQSLTRSMGCFIC